jgi:hypothetical protein
VAGTTEGSSAPAMSRNSRPASAAASPGCPRPIAEPAARVDINRIQAECPRRLVPSAAFRNIDATKPDFGPACFGAAGCLYALIHLPARMLSCVAERVTKPIRNREARVTEPHVA